MYLKTYFAKFRQLLTFTAKFFKIKKKKYIKTYNSEKIMFRLKIVYIYRELAEKQINYMLGASGRSYQIGFGTGYPRYPYHKSSFCPLPPEPCPRFDNSIPNTFVQH